MKTEHAVFRIRGFTCGHCADETQFFGDGEAPTHCLGCHMELMSPVPHYDQLVTTTKTVEHINFTGSQ